MPKELERDLGLYATVTISIGAMVGSGIFVLPGLAAEMAGPAVILAYPLAGLVVLPAALSKAEMATAMPESGGTYLFIDRAMGPLPGTIAGLGAWFTLLFESAFALVGLGAYLLLFAPLPTKPVALALGVALLVVNLVGVKQTLRARADRDDRGEEGRPQGPRAAEVHVESGRVSDRRPAPKSRYYYTAEPVAEVSTTAPHVWHTVMIEPTGTDGSSRRSKTTTAPTHPFSRRRNPLERSSARPPRLGWNA
jgi:hypothetical protein